MSLTIQVLAFASSIVLSATVSQNLNATATRIRGELGGRSILRCSFSPKRMAVTKVEWRTGEMFNLVFIYLADRTAAQGSRGQFKHRKAEGKYNSHGSYHELTIDGSQLQDEADYTCIVVDKNGDNSQSTVFLSLVGLPDGEPIIRSETGIVWAKPSPLCVVKEMSEIHDVSLICFAEKSRPASKVRWSVSNSTNVRIFEEKFNQTKTKGITLTAVSRKVIISEPTADQIECNCTVYIPKSTSSDVEQITMCLHIKSVEDTLNVSLIAFESVVILLMTIGWMWISRIDGDYLTAKGGWLLFSTFCATVTLFLLVAAVGAMHIIYGQTYKRELRRHGMKVDTTTYHIVFPTEYPIIGCSILFLRFCWNIVAAGYLLIYRKRIKGADLEPEDGKTMGIAFAAMIVILGPGARALWWWKKPCNPEQHVKDVSVAQVWSVWATTLVHSVLLVISMLLLGILYVSSEPCFDFENDVRSCRKSRSEPTIALYLFYAFVLVLYMAFLGIIYMYRRMDNKDEKTKKENESMLKENNIISERTKTEPGPNEIQNEMI